MHKARNQVKMGEEFITPKGVFEAPQENAAFRDKPAGMRRFSAGPIASAIESLSEAGDWRSLLSGYVAKVSGQARELFAVFVVVSRDLQLRWTTHQDMIDQGAQLKYEELLPLNADFGDPVKTIRGPSSGITLIDEIALSTGSSEFTLFRGTGRGSATLYLYTGGRRKLTEEEAVSFSYVTAVFDAIIKREFSVGEQLAHSARLSAAIELGRQIGDNALAGSFMNRAADTIQKKIGIDYVALMVLDDKKREVEFAGISESLTPLYDTPQSMKPGNVILAALGQKEPLIINEIENSGYRPLGTGVRWAALVPLDTHSKRNALLVLESKSPSPYSDGELKDIEIVSSLLSDRLSTSISVAEKERKVLVRNMLLEELLLLHRQSDPAKIAEEALSFIESVVPSTISVFYALNESRTTLIPVTSRGFFAEEMLSYSVPVGEGIVGKAISSDMPEVINDAHADLRAINLPGGSGEPESILVMPIKSIKEDIGVITLHRSGRKGFSAEDLDSITLISRQLSTVMERANATVEMRKVVSEKEAEATLTSQLADEFIAALSDERLEALPGQILRKCTETAGCESGCLFIRLGSYEEFKCVAQRPTSKLTGKKEVRHEDIESLKKESVHLANNTYVLEDGYKVEDACENLGIGMDRNALKYEMDNIRPYLMLYHEESVPGCETVFAGVGYTLSKSKQLFRGYLLQKLLNFFEIRYSRIHDRKADTDELLRTKKASYFKDAVYAETDLGRLFEKVVPIIGDLVGASMVSIYLANYTTSSFEVEASCTYNGMSDPPEKMVMSQAGKLLSSLDTHKKVVRIAGEEDGPFSSLFSHPMLVGKISSMDGLDYVVIAAFEQETDLSAADKLLPDLLKALSSKVRQLTALNRERQRTGLLNLIDDISRTITKQGEFSRMLDAVSSAAGHLIGAEYSLVGFMNASNIEWSGYYETRVPEAVERLAVRSMEKGEESIVNDMSGLEIGPDEDMPGSISNLMVFPVTRKESNLPAVFILLFNKLNGEGFNENDAWILERLGSNILGSIKTIEALKQEKIMKRKAELKKAELSELLDGIEGGIIRLDSDGAVSFANSEARRMFSLSQNDSSQKIVELLSDTDSLQVIDLLDSLKKGERFEGTYTFKVEGALKRISVSGKQIVDHGKRKGTVLFTRVEGTVREGALEAQGLTGLAIEKHAEIRNMRFEMRRGFSYAISEEKPSVAYATLLDLLAAGFEALVISRDHPSRLSEKYNLGKSDLRWLTQVVGNNNLDPSKLSVITSAIITFLEKHENSVIFIDGLEYLLANNNMIRVIAMLENVMQKVVDNGAVVIAAINRLTFDQKDLAMIGKMFEELDTNELKKKYLNREIEEFGEGKDDSSNIDAND